MKSNYDLVFQSVPLSPATACSYFPERQSQARAFRLEGDVARDFYDVLLDTGYRRCGDIYYQQNCPVCKDCISYRLPLADRKLSRSQQRVLRRNRAIDFSIGIPRLTAKKEHIYVAYQHHQHYERDVASGRVSTEFSAEKELETMHFQMYANPSLSREFELRLHGQLLGFGIIDLGIQSVSSVYFVFDPAFRRLSLGTLAIIASMRWAAAQGFRFCHLGFYIPNHPKMDYKRRFLPAQFLNRDTGMWQSVEDDLAAYEKREDC